MTCRLIARRPISDEIWPARQIERRESMCDYLLCREASIRQGEGFIQSSTLLVPRALLLQVPFTSGLPRHQDWDWLIKASAHPGVAFLWVWDPLVIYHISSRARAYFYATQIAVRCKTPATLWRVICNTLRHPRALLIGMGLALVPRSLVYSLRRRGILTHA